MTVSGSFPGEYINQKQIAFKKQLLKAGYQPTKEIMILLQQLDSLTNTMNTLEDIAILQKEQRESPEVLKVVHELTTSIVLQKISVLELE